MNTLTDSDIVANEVTNGNMKESNNSDGIKEKQTIKKKPKRE